MAGIALVTGNPNLQGLVRDLCFEKSTDTGLFDSATVLNNIINIAYRRVYNRVAAKGPTVLALRSVDKTTNATNTEQLDISSANLNAHGALSIVMVEYKNLNSVYVPLTQHKFYEGEYPGTANAVSKVTDPEYWTTLGQIIFVRPQPIAAVTLRITYVPGIVALSADTDMPFGGELQQFHELVAYEAAYIALSKDRMPQYIKSLRDDAMTELDDYVSNYQGQRSRHVLMVDGDNN